MNGSADGRASEEADARRFVRDFAARHAPEVVPHALAALRRLKVLVVGEAIIDEYSYCVALGKAPKDPVLSTKHVRLESQAGGALACANHVAGFCDEVHLVTGLGADDSREDLVRRRLRANVRPRFFLRDGAPTITKRRYVSEPGLLKLFEVAVMDDTPLPRGLEDELLAYLDPALPAYDLVVVTDYGHGFLGPRTVDLLGARARFLAVNTQANPANLGFHVVTKYPRAAYVCLDEGEARLAVRDRTSPVDAVADALRASVTCSVMSVTRGHRGVLVSSADGGVCEVPALTRDVVDRMGAGDAYLAVSAAGAAARLPLDVLALLGSAAGAVAVRVVGNRAAVEPAAVERLIAGLRG